MTVARQNMMFFMGLSLAMDSERVQLSTRWIVETNLCYAIWQESLTCFHRPSGQR